MSYPFDQSNPLVGFDTIGIEYAPKRSTPKRMAKDPRSILMLSGRLLRTCCSLLDQDQVELFHDRMKSLTSKQKDHIP